MFSKVCCNIAYVTLIKDCYLYMHPFPIFSVKSQFKAPTCLVVHTDLQLHHTVRLLHSSVLHHWHQFLGFYHIWSNWYHLTLDQSRAQTGKWYHIIKESVLNLCLKDPMFQSFYNVFTNWSYVQNYLTLCIQEKSCIKTYVIYHVYLRSPWLGLTDTRGLDWCCRTESRQLVQ